ncbi:hypothetical protein GCM10027093_61400 [Paraburkholderia jirisanensis]
MQADAAMVLPRRLDSMEEVFWQFEQFHPYAPVFAVEIDGRIDPHNWAEHIRAVQSRYPLLSARISKLPGERPSFEPVTGVDLPFQQRPLAPGERVETIMERELSIGFGDGSGALARVSLLHGSNRAVLLLAAHHAACDGRTMMMIVEDLLCAASGKPLAAPFEGATDIRQVLGLPENGGYRTLLGKTGAAGLPGAMEAHVERAILSEALSAAMLSQCKARAVNVRSLIAAAVAEAGRARRADWQSRPVNILSPIDLRPMLGRTDTPGVLIGLSAAVVPAAATRNTLWEDAAGIGLAFQQAANVEAQKERSLKLRELLEVECLPHTFAAMWQNRLPTADIMINNYGRITLQDDYGDFRIKAISSASIAGLGVTQKVSVIALHGQIGICLATCDPIDGILESASTILADACVRRSTGSHPSTAQQS